MPGLFCQRRNFVIFRSRHKDQLQIIAVNVHTAEQHSLLPEQFVAGGASLEHVRILRQVQSGKV